ncbi:hypothetical protein QUB80_10365 [Chlorogloeopsis sp. ULAP01]|uniref:hypothetical protein n=1 Tax=Chlorogloeopsis sp. ULAP01 TaxID=3056483 RepID=UPI0025AA8C11|nr:hypothetical protein [Chlorogloeopsis sp. ULAP01]MDM9381107.1 hypothetical protein [Chlorogloeopsis sp. ULAP01]
MAFGRKQLEMLLENTPEFKNNILGLDALEDDPIPVKLVDKYQHGKEKNKNVVEVEPWEELEPMPEGEVRIMTRQFLYVDGVEVEVCTNTNGKYFVRHNVYWWIMHRQKNPDPHYNRIIENLKNRVDGLPTIRWSGYRFRFETIVFEEDDVEVESVLLPLTMFEDLIKNDAKPGDYKILEEIQNGEYKSKPNDNVSLKLFAWLNSNLLFSLLQTKNS